MNNLIRNQYLSVMGIDVWVSRDNNDQKNINPEKIVDKVIYSLDWNDLETTVKQCQCCELHKTRKNSVFGSGNKQADLFIVGSIPNQKEDDMQLEFIDSEGALLENMLHVLNLSRKDVYVTNLLKCQARNYRQFTSTEMEKCTSHFERQVALVKPKVLIIFGEQVARFILKTDNNMATLTAQLHDYPDKDLFVMVIEHPEQLLISGAAKKQAWLSLLKIKTMLTTEN